MPMSLLIESSIGELIWAEAPGTTSGRDTRVPAPGAVASAPKRVVLKVVPRRVTSWDHRKLGGGY
jgi:hypothetical protein